MRWIVVIGAVLCLASSSEGFVPTLVSPCFSGRMGITSKQLRGHSYSVSLAAGLRMQSKNEGRKEKPADALITKPKGEQERPRAAARAAKKAQESGVSSKLRMKLLEEQANPFRKFRQTIYLACAGSAAIGGFIAATRVAAGLAGVEGVQPLVETVPNVGIDFGVVAASVGLWFWEDGRGKEAIESLTEKSGAKTLLSDLEVELFDGAKSTLDGLKGSYRPVLLTGTASEVTRSINLASRVAADLKRNDMLLVPFFTDLEDDSAGWTAMKESSSNGLWDSFLARPLDREAWSAWLDAEKVQVAEKNKENSRNIDTKAFDKLLRVFIMRMDGKVGSRTVGPPAWPKLIKSVESLPAKDRYGTP